MNLHTLLKRALVLAVLGLLASPTVRANTITASVGGATLGSQRVNFDDLVLGTAGGLATGPDGSVAVSFASGGKAVQGALSGKYAAPWLSGGNGTGFGVQPNGVDTTTYLTTGTTGSSVTLDFGPSASLNYFGLLWGSVDSYNSLSFYNGNTLLSSVTGTQVWAGANGNQGVNGTLYVNIDTSSAFNKVVARSAGYAFEFDNVAYRSVPDNASTLVLLGLGFIGLAARSRFVK